jgi:methionyl-tRNA formyltransferase
LSNPRLLFLGTAPIAVPALKACLELEHMDLVGVVSQPPSRQGRGRKTSPSAVHQAAQTIGLEVAIPDRFAGDQGDEILARYQPDLCLVMAYGQIIKAPHLSACPDRWFNLHGSLLPRWRGAAPIERCLEAGDQMTGVQLMRMEVGLDTGPVFAERKISTTGHDAGSLADALALEAAQLTSQSLRAAFSGELEPQHQNEHDACYAHRIQRSEGHINFLGKAVSWERKSRAFDPRLGLRCSLLQRDKVVGLKIWSASVVPDLDAEKPGKIIRCDRGGLWVSCEDGVLAVHSLQLDGKKRLNWSEVRSGLSLTLDDHFVV